MTRVEKMQQLAKHPYLKNLFKKLTKEELEMTAKFIYENQDLSNDQYLYVVNRWMLDQKKPKHFADMWSIALQSV